MRSMFQADLRGLSDGEEVDQVSSQNPESTTGSFRTFSLTITSGVQFSCVKRR